MAAPAPKRVEEVFLDVVDLPIAEREQALRARCDGDVDLLDRVKRLLAADATNAESSSAKAAIRIGAGLGSRTRTEINH